MYLGSELGNWFDPKGITTGNPMELALYTLGSAPEGKSAERDSDCMARCPEQSIFRDPFGLNRAACVNKCRAGESVEEGKKALENLPPKIPIFVFAVILVIIAAVLISK